MSPDPFILIGTSSREALTSRFTSALGAWRSTWAQVEFGPIALEVGVQSAAMLDCQGGVRVTAAYDEDESLEICIPSAFWTRIVGIPADGVTSELTRRDSMPGKARWAVLTALTHALVGRSPTSLNLTSGSGSPVIGEAGRARRRQHLVVRALNHGDSVSLATAWTLGLLLPLLPERAMLPPVADVGDRRTQIAATQTSVSAELGSVEVPVGEFLQLRPGDVLVLGHALTAPASVESSRGQVVCVGKIGQRRGRRAIEIVEPLNQ